MDSQSEMTAERVAKWLCGGEGPTVDFKREFTTGMARDLVAFANGMGGVVLIGVEDDASVVGIGGVPRRLEERVMGLCRSAIRPTLTPQVSLVDMAGATVMVVAVGRGEQKPYTADDICYVRAGSTSRRARPEELRRLALNGAYTEYELTAVAGATGDDFDVARLAAHVERRAPGAISINGLGWADVAQNQGWARRGDDAIVPTVAGLLLFGERPQRLRPQWGVGAVRVSGTALDAPIVDRADLEGNLAELLKGTADFVRRNLRVAAMFDTPDDPLTRRDVPEYPLAAVREAVVNALAHRDYSRPGRIAVRMFDDRLVVWNPGGLPGDLRIEGLLKGGQSVPRNHVLASTLREWGKMEEVGRGVLLIARELRQLGSTEPRFESCDEYFQVALPSRHAGAMTAPNRR